MQHLPFYLTKALLTLLSKDVGYLLMKPILNIIVEVIELHAHLTSQDLPDGGLAGSHITYQDDSFHTFDALLPRLAGLASDGDFSAFSTNALHSS